MRTNTRVRVHFSLKLSLRRTNVKLVCTRQHLQSCNNLKTDSKTTEKRYTREETRGKLCHADVFSLFTIENYINSKEKTIRIIEVNMVFLCKSYTLRNLYHLLLCFLYMSI